MNNIFKAVLLLSFLSIGLIQAAHASEGKKVEDYMPSLITKTPLEGRMLAIKMVRKTIGTIQRDPEIKQAVRNKYKDDPQLLMYAAELVAIEFKTIAIANKYWR
ncbi:MAG: hexameric tyrosine-coordinated heme protein [Pseudomonadales bacterium]